MRKIYQTLVVAVLVITTFLSSGYAQVNERCGTQQWLENEFAAHPELRAQYEQREKALGQAITNRLAGASASNTNFIGNITIPIVFHVVGNAALQASITDAKIQAQLNVLNIDYGGLNPDSANIPAAFQAVRGHGRVTFVFAQRTPSGGATTGINRVTTNTVSCGTSCTNDPVKFTSDGGADAWDATKYINVWLCSFSNSQLLGYATFPMGTTEANQNGNPPLNKQGVVVLAQTIPGGTAAPYNLGRTLTHELGHFFWLRHINGDGNCGNDFPNTPGIDDTPSQSDLTGGCPGSAPNVNFQNSGCSGFPNPPGRMYQNYMDYTSDACMTMFTNGQNMRSEMAIDMYRPGLVNSDGALPPSGFSLTAPAAVSTSCGGSATLSSTLTTVSNGGYVVPINFTYSGNPAGTTVSFGTNPVVPGNTTTVVLNNINTLIPGTYNITVTGVSGSNTVPVVVPFVVTAGTAPTLTGPAAQTGCVGSTATFTVTSSIPATSYQWQVSTAAVPAFTNIAGATSATYTIAATTAAQNGNQYRVIVNTQCASATSAAALLTVQASPAITAQPQSIIVCDGTNATFSVTATGAGLGYQWQQSIDNGFSFQNISGATAATYTVTGVTAGQSGYQYRVNVQGTCLPAVTTSAAILTVGDAAAITTGPSNSTVCVGANASFSVVATGSSLTYQWQVSTAAVPAFTDISGATASTYTITGATAVQSGNQYRVVVFSCTPTGINSTAATLTVNTPVAIGTQPVASTVCSGATATFSVAATGTNLSYQWQYAATCAGTFNNLSGETAATLSLANVGTPNAGAYRVAVTGACGTVNSSCVLLTVNVPVTISAQPTDFSICLPVTGTVNGSFTVAAAGTALAYQWQVSTVAAPTFVDVAGATSATLTLTNLTAAMNGNKYRAVLSGTCTPSLISAVANLTVNTPVNISAQPQSKAICSGDNTSFAVTATGSTITYQWQVNINGGPYINVNNGGIYSGATTNTLTLTNVTTLNNGYKYRVVVSGVPCGAVNSSEATLTVNQTPTVELSLKSYSNITPYIRTALYPIVSPAAGPYTYAWYRNGNLLNGVGTSPLPVSVDDLGTYTVRATNSVTGCFDISDAVTLSDSASNILFVYPNPSSGKFEVRYYNRGGASHTRTLSVYDAKGGKVFKQQFTLTGVYAKMPVDLSAAGSGVYYIDLSDGAGKRIASGRVVIKR